MILTRFSLGTAALALVALTACEAPLPGQTNENRNTNAAVGAGIGAIFGAATGDDPDERIRNALIGAAAGGAIGAAGGAMLDRQEAELRQQLGSNVGIVNTGDSLVVRLPQDILFATDSAQLTGALQSDLRTVAASLNRYPDTTVNVVGHADNTGSASYNQDLSQRRAASVASVLINSGVNPGRIRSFGRGEDQPIATNLTPEGRAQNRRVEIVITPN